jgi:Spy/CpxP family protein refolding chaperone
MKPIRINSLRIMAAIAISAALITGVTSTAWANPASHEEMKQNWAKHRQEWIKARLAKMADRLEIKSSQQAAWQAYVKVVEAPVDIAAKKPDAPADAATIVRARADFAAARAKKMAQVADATTKLQEVLTPEQRKTFDQMVQHALHRGQHRMMHRDHHSEEGRGWQHNDR